MGSPVPIDLEKVTKYQYDQIHAQENSSLYNLKAKEDKGPEDAQNEQFIIDSVEQDQSRSLFKMISRRYLKSILNGEVAVDPKLLR